MEDSRKQSSLKMNLIYQMCYKILVLITPFITSPYISRVLGAEALGLYSFTLSIVNYFLMFVYLGIDNYGCRVIAETRGKNDDEKLKQVFWEVYLLQLITGSIALAEYGIYCTFFVVENIELFIIQGIAIIAATIDINWYFAGTEQFKLTVTRNFIIKLVTVGSIFVFVKNQKDLPLYALIMVLGTFGSQVVMWLFLKKEITLKKVSLKGIFSHLKPNILLFIPVIGVSIYHTMDNTMLGLLSDYTNVGYYYNADKIISMPLGMITGLSAVFLPRMANLVSSKGLSAGQNLLKKSFELNFALACSMAFGIVAVAKDFVPWFFGTEFIPCTSLIAIFAPVLIIKTLSDFLQTQLLIPTNNEKIYTVATFCGAGINLVLNLVFIPKFGAWGATIGTLGAEIAVLLIEGILSIKLFNIFTQVLNNLIYIIAALVMYVSVFMIEKFLFFDYFINVIIEVLTGVVIFAILVVPYSVLNKNCVFNKYFKNFRNQPPRNTL